MLTSKEVVLILRTRKFAICLSLLLGTYITTMAGSINKPLPGILSEEGYTSFFQTAINAVLNEEVFNPYNYDDFLNIGFRENGFLEEAFENYIDTAKGNTLFVDFPTYVNAILEDDSYMERAYNEFTTLFGKEDLLKESKNVEQHIWYEDIFKEYISPLDVYIEETSPYGMRTGSMHYGTDVRVAIGTSIYAAEEGIAYKVGPDSKGVDNGGGKMIFIKHPNGTETRYMHLDEYAIEEGVHVEKGQLIGRTGNTGSTTGGGHLHLELLVNGEWIDSDVLFKKNPEFVPY